MPKIKVIVSHCLGGGRDVAEGEILEVSVAEARRKIEMGFAVAVDELPAPKGMVHFADAPPSEKPEA